MANTLKFGNGQFATKKGSTLAYNDENGNFKPLPFTFDRSTSATRVNKQGLIEVVSNNEPRIDFLNDSKGALLLEPSRSNLILSSEDISGTGWGRTGWTLTDGFISPDGTNNAYSILRTTGASFATTLSLSANTTYTYSVYIKNVDATNIQLRVQNSAGNSSGTESNCIVFQVTDQTNTDDFVRITHTFNTGDAGSYGIFLGYYSAGEYIAWGAQLEQGSYATSYIPTQGSIGTRVAESCIDAGNDQVFNGSEGVLYFNYKALVDDNQLRMISIYNEADINNRIVFRQHNVGSDVIRFFYQSSGTVYDATLDIGDITDYNKIAFKWANSNFAIYVNGVKYLEQLSGATTATGLNKINFAQFTDAFALEGGVKDLRVYNEALTDQELINLTKI